MKKRIFCIMISVTALLLSACSIVPEPEKSSDENKQVGTSFSAGRSIKEAIAANLPESLPETCGKIDLAEENAGEIEKNANLGTLEEDISIEIIEKTQDTELQAADKVDISVNSEPILNIEHPKAPAENENTEEILQVEIPVQEPVPTPLPTETPPSTPEPPPIPDFDINYWVEYAKGHGQSIGLVLDSTATACWDNPIIASPVSANLERDIQDLLNWYIADGNEYFTVWAEERSDGKYNLYIGYA